MPIEFQNIVYEKSYGATATTLTEEFEAKKPVSQINLTMHYLQNGATLDTIANVLTQFATTIRVKLNGETVLQLSATDLKNLVALAYGFGNVGQAGDGTGADNHVKYCTLPIPFGRTLYPHCVDKEVALPSPTTNLVIEMDVPADANAIDGRKLTAMAVIPSGASPSKYIQRVVKTVTPSGAGSDTYCGLPYGGRYSLYDLLLFQTTALDAGSTTDTTTIEKLRLELNERPSGLLENGNESFMIRHHNLSKLANAPSVQDTYIHIPFCPGGDLGDAVPLSEAARIWFNPGDTNAIRVIPGILTTI